jgi:dTDP-4-dehydrorhamnose reductase
MFGHDMKSRLESAGLEVSGFNRSNLDLSATPDELSKKLEQFDVIINSVAYTLVDQAEKEPDLAFLVNGTYAGKLARIASATNARFMHISTDYVFDGSSRFAIALDETLKPMNAYGRSKALGEELVLGSDADFVILRTAWLYGAHGRCFPRAIARKLRNGELTTVVDDQIGQPTWTMDLAEIVLSHAIHDYKEKIVHAVSSGQTSWYEFACTVGDSLGADVSRIQPVSSSNFPTPARRPFYSVLDNTHTQGPKIGYWRDRWQVAAREVLELA